MTSYLPQSRFLEGGRALYAQTNQTVEGYSKTSEASQLVDTISSAEHPEKCFKGIEIGSRPSLPPPNGEIPQDDLMILAKAYCEAFTAVNEGAITESGAYTNLQQLDQSQAKALLDTTRASIEQVGALAKEAADLAKYEEEMNTVNSVLGKIFLAVTIVMIILTIGAGVASGGAADAALPEEVEALEGTGAGLAEGGEEASTDLQSTLQTLEEAPKNAETETSVPRTCWNKTVEAVDSPVGRKLLRIGGGAVFGLPQLMKGITGIVVAKRRKELSIAQGKIGPAISSEQTTSMYFQFLQQALQREGGVFREEISGAGEILETYGEIMNAYKGISYGLANSA